MVLRIEIKEEGINRVLDRIASKAGDMQDECTDSSPSDP